MGPLRTERGPLSQFTPDLSFLRQLPSEPRSELESIFASRHLMVCGSWQSAWQNVAGFCLELQEICTRHGMPEIFDKCLSQVGPGQGELKEMMRAKMILGDPKYAALVADKISPKQICGAVDAYRTEQIRLNTEAVTVYDVVTQVQDLSFETLGSSDVLNVSPNVAGITGEQTVKSILDALNISYTPQWPNAYGPCDFRELKKPDFKVGTVKSLGDARLANGFYIESTQRLSERSKDLGLFYLLHQIVHHADLPTIVVYDGPQLSQSVWDWAQEFKAKHERTNRLFAVANIQQFREWALRKIGRQS